MSLQLPFLLCGFFAISLLSGCAANPSVEKGGCAERFAPKNFPGKSVYRDRTGQELAQVKILQRGPIVYPTESLRRGEEGGVVLLVQIGPDGKVLPGAEMQILESNATGSIVLAAIAMAGAAVHDVSAVAADRFPISYQSASQFCIGRN